MNLYIDLLEKVVRNEIYLADFYDSTNIGDIPRPHGLRGDAYSFSLV